jgi:parallel beta-helix repeat protein
MRSIVSCFGPATWVLAIGAAGAIGAVAGCGGSDTKTTGGSGGGSSSSSASGSGGAAPGPCDDAPKIKGCTTAVKPSSDDYTAIETAFETASAGDTICLCPGTYKIRQEISLNVENVTVRGAGAAISDVVLDFKDQKMGDDAWSVTSNGFDVENMTIKNTLGNGLVVTGAKGVTYKDMKFFWDAGSSMNNGSYAAYPVSSENVLIDNVEVVGAADAAIYVGQCTHSIVRNSKAHDSVAGIESENNTDCEIYDNESYDNTAGILVFALPDKEKKTALDTNVHDNNVHDNNRDNFAKPGSTVANVPVGIGILILAADYAEVHKNTIKNQKTVGLTMVSLNTFAVIQGKPVDDPKTDPFPEHAYIYDNTFTNVGYDPVSPLSALPNRPVEDVVWDGDERTMGSADLCLGTSNLPTFRDVNGLNNIGNPMNQSTDTTPFQCVGKVHMPVKF